MTAAETLDAQKVESPKRPWWMKTVAALAVAAVSFVAFMGFLHTKWGLSLRAVLFGSCPMGNASPDILEPSVARLGAAKRGDSPAPRKDMLFFELGKTTRSAAKVWANEAHVTCELQRDDTFMRCANVPSTALGRPSTDGAVDVEMVFRQADEILYNLQIMHTGSASDLRAVYNRIGTTWVGALGPVPPGGTLVAPPNSSARLDYHFSDLAYELTYVDFAPVISVEEHVLRTDGK
jgi:hypothetical protein